MSEFRVGAVTLAISLIFPTLLASSRSRACAKPRQSRPSGGVDSAAVAESAQGGPAYRSRPVTALRLKQEQGRSRLVVHPAVSPE